MLGKLVAKECRQLLKSLIFYLYLILIVLFYVAQLGEFNVLEKPREGQESYGTGYSDDPDVIMKATLGKLVDDCIRNSFGTYPIGFYKQVILNEKERNDIKSILKEATGEDWEQLKGEYDDFHDQLQNKLDAGMDPMSISRWAPDIEPKETLTYEAFEAMMEEVNDVLGGGSSYRAALLYRNASIDLTYEQALNEYNSIVEEDRVTNAYARLFCDYLGVMIGILPVFLAVARSLRDKRAKANQVIYSKQVSSATLILSRYLATTLMILLPVLVLGGMMQMQCTYYGESLGANVDHLAFLKHIGGWLLPTMLFGLSAGFLITEMTESPLAILVQMILFMVSLMLSMGRGTLVGNFGIQMIPRWNTLGSSDEFAKQLPLLIQNRIFYFGLAMVLLAGTVIVYGLKRKGVWKLHGTLARNRKSKS